VEPPGNLFGFLSSSHPSLWLTHAARDWEVFRSARRKRSRTTQRKERGSTSKNVRVWLSATNEISLTFFHIPSKFSWTVISNSITNHLSPIFVLGQTKWYKSKAFYYGFYEYVRSYPQKITISFIATNPRQSLGEFYRLKLTLKVLPTFTCTYNRNWNLHGFRDLQIGPKTILLPWPSGCLWENLVQIPIIYVHGLSKFNTVDHWVLERLKKFFLPILNSSFNKFFNTRAGPSGDFVFLGIPRSIKEKILSK